MCSRAVDGQPAQELTSRGSIGLHFAVPFAVSNTRSRSFAITAQIPQSRAGRATPLAFDLPKSRRSDGEIIGAELGVVEDVAGITGKDDFAHVENCGTVGELERRNGVLLDDDGGDALGLDAGDDRLYFAHDCRGEPLIGLVEEEELDLTGERTGDGRHRLPAAR